MSIASKIRILDEHTINKIAAGEVIENPSSVVKELVDNSIDSGASEISVEISGGGRQLIRVTDNGCGMTPDDAVLCLERHATSKIQSVDDILKITSMGFRGEAIPSIASISKFTLLTSPEEGGEKGTMVIVEGGRILKVCEAARSRGTTIEVKSLFFNVPVRKKFQRSPNYDSGEILKMLVKLALANPEIKIELISNQKLTLETRGALEGPFSSRLSERVADVLGQEFIDQCCPVENVCDSIEVHGYIGLPANTRHNRTGQYVFINRRAVFSPLVQHAVREGYSTTLPANRHPLFLLHIVMPGDLVDINVHPQKKEVRLRQEQLLKRAVTQAVDRALHGSGAAFLFHDEVPMEELLQNERNGALFTFSDNHFPRPEEGRFALDAFPQPAEGINFSQKGFGGIPAIYESMYKESGEICSEQNAFHRPQTLKMPPLPSEPPKSAASAEPQSEPTLFSDDAIKPRFKGIVIGTIPGYILLDGNSLGDSDSCLYLVDQKAAHSRVLFETLLDKNRRQAIEIVQLLVPITLELTHEESALLSQNLDLLTDLGFALKEFGKHCFIIDAVPTLFGEIDSEAFVHELIHSLGKGEEGWIEGEIERRIAGLASRLSLSRNTKMSIEEAKDLVDRLLSCNHPFQSPTGQQTISTFDRQELSKRFQ